MKLVSREPTAPMRLEAPRAPEPAPAAVKIIAAQPQPTPTPAVAAAPAPQPAGEEPYLPPIERLDPETAAWNQYGHIPKLPPAPIGGAMHDDPVFAAAPSPFRASDDSDLLSSFRPRPFAGVGAALQRAFSSIVEACSNALDSARGNNRASRSPWDVD